MDIDLVKTKNPIRRMLFGTWYKANVQGEKLLWLPYTSFLCSKVSVEEWLGGMHDAEIEANIQFAFDRWNFGPGNEFDYKILRLLQNKQEGLRLDEDFLNQPMHYIPWTTPLGITKNIGFYIFCGLVISVTWCIDHILRSLPYGVEKSIEDFLERRIEKLLGKDY